MGRRPKARGRDVHGLILLNKPSGMTSNQCLQQVKRLLNANRAGHTGSLDKPATGMLPICLGEATKLSQFLLNADKEYISHINLGITTDTGDASGTILQQQPVPELAEAKLLDTLATFQGEIEQIPPMYSALKHQGQRLYTLAYQHQEVEREARKVTIKTLDLLERKDNSFVIRVVCSKGTYIRTLAMDIGQAIGCGAHVEQLYRVRVGRFAEDDMVGLAELEHSPNSESFLLPMEQAVDTLPEIDMEQQTAEYLKNGQAVLVPNAPTTGIVRLYDQERRFIGIGQILDDGRVAPKRLFNLGN